MDTSLPNAAKYGDLDLVREVVASDKEAVMEKDDVR